MRTVKTLLLSVFCIVVSNIQAQDIHFTQYNMSPLTLNPGFIGKFSGTARIGGIYRDQWSSVLGSGKYATPAIYVDAPIIRGFRRNDWIGVGLGFLSDKTGTVALKRSSFALGAAYHLALDKKGTAYLSVGGEYGSESRDLDRNALDFTDNIETGNSGKPQLSEDWQKLNQSKANFTDINAGALLSAKLNKKMDFNFGVGMFHLAKPKYALLNGGQKLPSRLSAHGQFNIEMNKKWSIHPSFLFQTISGADEIALQGLAGYKFDTVRDIDLNFGLGYRLRDALEILAGGRYKNLRVGVAYDVNTSGLNSQTNGRGGFELAANYIIKIYKPAVVKPKVICPRF